MGITAKKYGTFVGNIDAVTLKVDGEKITATPSELNNNDLDVVGAVSKLLKINITAPEDSTEQSTGVILPDKAIVKNVFVDVITAEVTGTTKTINVGTDSTDSGDADGYLTGLSVSTTGLKKGTVANGAVTLGALLLTDLDGTSNIKEPDIASGGKEITFTTASANFAELNANIFIEYIEIA